jgi:predicted nucleotide-binding protein
MKSRNRRIFVSAPREESLKAQGNICSSKLNQYKEFKKAIKKQIEKIGYEQVRFGEDENSELTGSDNWTMESAEKVIAQCVGAILIGIPFWLLNKSKECNNKPWLTTEYCHYEGAIAHKLKLPILAISAGVKKRVIFTDKSSAIVLNLNSSDPNLIKEKKFEATFNDWMREVKKRRDVFLGYCSRETDLALYLRKYLESEFNVSVLDWKTDFVPGPTILEELDYAASVCSTGIFLFTEDDKQGKDLKEGIYVPRDNVVFETGYFINSKGNERVLIIRKGDTKIPMDLGGKIYPELDDNSSVKSIDKELEKFINIRLGPGKKI